MDIAGIIDLAAGDEQSGRRRAAVDRYTDISCWFELEWRSAGALHTDYLFQPRLNLWQDLFPFEMEALMEGNGVGDSVTVPVEPGGLVPAYRAEQCVEVPADLFMKNASRSGIDEARAGRFYPKRFIAGSHGIFEQDITPMRMTGVGPQLEVDLNHPLANFQASLTVHIVDIASAGRQGGARNAGPLARAANRLLGG